MARPTHRDVLRGTLDPHSSSSRRWPFDPWHFEPGESSSAEMVVTIPNGMPLGPAYLCLIADVPGSVAESDETNNRRLAPIEIGKQIFVDGFESGDLTLWTNVVP